MVGALEAAVEASGWKPKEGEKRDVEKRVSEALGDFEEVDLDALFGGDEEGGDEEGGDVEGGDGETLAQVGGPAGPGGDGGAKPEDGGAGSGGDDEGSDGDSSDEEGGPLDKLKKKLGEVADALDIDLGDVEDVIDSGDFSVDDVMGGLEDLAGEDFDWDSLSDEVLGDLDELEGWARKAVEEFEGDDEE